MAKRQREADCLSISFPLAALPQGRKNVSCQCGGISRRVEILCQQNTTQLLTEHNPYSTNKHSGKKKINTLLFR
jgi:hypothetical protein